MDDQINCTTCKGRKSIRMVRDDAPEDFGPEHTYDVPCPACGGRGTATMVAGVNVDPAIAKVEELLDLFGIGTPKK